MFRNMYVLSAGYTARRALQFGHLERPEGGGLRVDSLLPTIRTFFPVELILSDNS